MLIWLKKHAWLSIGVSITLTLLFFGSLFVDIVREICEKDEYTGAKECARHHLGPWAVLGVAEFIDAHNGVVTALATLAMAAFTGTLWRATTEQGKLTKQSIDLARAEFASTHRPRIILREAIIGSVMEGEPIRPLLSIANVGETDGIIVRSTVDIEIVNTSSPDRRFLLGSVEPYNEIGPLLLPPGVNRLIGWDQLSKREKSSTPPKWEADRFKIKSYIGPGKGPDGHSTRKTDRDFEIHVYGQFIYRDEAGVHRRTAFRRRLIPERQRFYRLEDEPDLDYAD